MKLYRSRIIAAALLGIGICASGAWGTTLRIVSYNIDCADQSSDNNITGATHSLPTVVHAIGLHHIGTNAQPVDVMSVEELTSTTLANFVAQLNAIYGAGTYAFDPTTDPNTGGGPDGVIYRMNTVQVVSARALKTGQTVLLQSNGTYTSAHSPGGGVNGVPRAPMVYQLRPVGFGSSDDFYFYVSHARSTSDDSVGDARYAEAQEVRSDAKYNLPAGAHIIYGGDWNLFNGSGENAYKCLTGQTTSDGINWSDGSATWANTNQTQAYDPMSKTTPPTTVTWANVAGDNATYLYGDATEGSFAMSSRIDIQLPNAPMFGVYNSQGGVQIAPDASDPFDTSNFPSSQYPYAFETFGNNGSTPRGSTPTSPANHSLDDLTNTVPSAATVYGDLVLTGSGGSFNGSDHYPIVGDYNVVVVPTGPAAIFSGAPTNGMAPLTVMFTDGSAGSISNRTWTFGDGGTSNTTATSVQYTYNAAGTNTVRLIVSGLGGSATNIKSGYIVVSSAGPPPPVASFTGSPTSGTEPLLVTFSDTSTGTITSRFWDFGDSSTTNVTTNSVSHTYAAGTYGVTLIVTGPGGTGTNSRPNYITALTAFQSWQVQYFGSTTNPAAVQNADPDGDGCNNLCEFLSGTDPTNSASSFHIISVAPQSADILVTWATAGGRTNVVQVSGGDVDGSYTTNFVDLSPFIIIPGSGDAITNYLDSDGATNGPGRYYRVRLVP
jgi:PKD repeat protein